MKRMLSFEGAIAVAVMMGGCGATGETGTDVTVIESALTGCIPGPFQASIFLGDMGTGSCNTLEIGVYRDAQAFGLPNDAITSIKLGRGTRAAVFAAANWGGTKTILTSNTNGLPHNISSIRVEYSGDTCELPSYRPLKGGVALYTAINFSGDCVVRHSFDLCLALSGYGLGAFADSPICIGLPNDTMSSAYIGPNTSATFCQADWFGGPCELMQNTQAVAQPQPDFRNNLIGNDTVSSLTVTQP